jgi:hypothetical protein
MKRTGRVSLWKLCHSTSKRKCPLFKGDQMHDHDGHWPCLQVSSDTSLKFWLTHLLPWWSERERDGVESRLA